MDGKMKFNAKNVLFFKNKSQSPIGDNYLKKKNNVTYPQLQFKSEFANNRYRFKI